MELIFKIYFPDTFLLTVFLLSHELERKLTYMTEHVAYAGVTDFQETIRGGRFYGTRCSYCET